MTSPRDIVDAITKRKKGDVSDVLQAQSVSFDRGLYYREIEKAAERIGRTAAQATQWLLRFERIDFDDVSSGELVNLASEVACMAEYQYAGKGQWYRALAWTDWFGEEQVKHALSVNDVAKAFGFQLAIKNGAHPSESDSLGTHLSYRFPSRQVLDELQEFVSLHLFELETAGGIIIDHRPLRTCVVPRPDVDENVVLRIAESPQSIFQNNVAFLLAETAVRVRRCQECKVMFYADRKNKHYHSDRCQSRAGTRRWRKTPPERVGRLGRPSKEEQSLTKGDKKGRQKIIATKKGGKDGKKGR